MRLNLRILSTPLILAAALAAATAPATQPAYPIKMHRDMKPGDTYDIHITAEHNDTRRNLSDPTAPPETHNSRFDLTARMKVQKVGSDGNPRSLTLTIRKFIDTAGNDLIAPDRILDLTIGEKETTVTPQGGDPIGDDAVNALRTIYFPYPDTDATDDQVYGTRTPRRLGESWSMDADAQAKVWRAQGWQIEAADITGQTTLIDIDSTHALLRLTSTVDAIGGRPPGIPPTIQVEGVETHSRTETVIPTDPSAPVSLISMAADGQARLTQPNPPIKWEVHGHSAHREEITPVK